jgi:hypothetical protein
MRELSIVETESTEGGCSFEEALFYATGQLYFLGQLASSDQFYPYHAMGVTYYTARLMACI